MKIEAFSIVVVPFPFTDSNSTKLRPAVVLSAEDAFGNRIGHSVMAMITSAKNTAWPLDVAIKDLKKAGLPSPSIVRMKWFTLDHRLVRKVVGTLAESDRSELRSAIRKLIP